MLINYRAVNQVYSEMNMFIEKDSSKENTTSIFHYTNTDVLDKILGNATFWATHILYLNDANEFYKGIKLINDVLKEESEVFHSIDVSSGDLYVISFSTEKDLLSQWITYAKESGVSIELDRKLLKTEAKEKGCRFVFGIEDDEKSEMKNCFQNIVFDTNYVVHGIRYIDSKTDNTIRKSIYECYSKACETTELAMPVYAAYYKDSSFSAENEIRAAFLYHDYSFDNRTIDSGEQVKTIHPKVYFQRTSKGILRPHINVQFLYCKDGGKDEEDIYSPELPIKSITVGPSEVQQTVFDSVVHRVKYGECKVFDYTTDEKRFLDNFNSISEEVYNWAKEKNYFDDQEGEGGIKRMLASKWVQANPEKKDLLSSILDTEKKQQDSFISQNNVSHISQDIDRNFFITKEGILIKKSKIPYIF